MKRTVEQVDVDAIFDKEIINIREFNGSYVSDISFIFPYVHILKEDTRTSLIFNEINT